MRQNSPMARGVVTIVAGPPSYLSTSMSRHLAMQLGCGYVSTNGGDSSKAVDGHATGAGDTARVSNSLESVVCRLTTGDRVVLDTDFPPRHRRDTIRRLCHDRAIPLVVVTHDGGGPESSHTRDWSQGPKVDRAGMSPSSRLNRHCSPIGPDEARQYEGVIHVRRDGCHCVPCSRSLTPVTAVLCALIVAGRTLTEHRTHLEYPSTLEKAIDEDLRSVSRLADRLGVHATYVRGSLATGELSWAWVHRSPVLLSDYDIVIVSRDPIDSADITAFTRRFSRLEQRGTHSVRRSHVGYRFYAIDELACADNISRAQFLVIAQRLSGDEVRDGISYERPSPQAAYSARDAWLYRLATLAPRLGRMLCSAPSPYRELRWKYEVVRTGLDIALCSCLDHLIIPVCHRQAVALTRILEGGSSASHCLSSFFLDWKVRNVCSESEARFPEDLAAAFRRVLSHGAERWDVSDTPFHDVVLGLAGICSAGQRLDSPERCLESVVAKALRVVQPQKLDDLFKELLGRAQQELYEQWPRTANSLSCHAG
jgi:hypothetical protein